MTVDKAGQQKMVGANFVSVGDEALDIQSIKLVGDAEDGGSWIKWWNPATKKYDDKAVYVEELYNPSDDDDDYVDTKEFKPIEDELNTSNSDYCEIEDTAFITFDEFTNYWDYDFSYDNYFENTLYLFQYANEQIRAHDIKNVVIDLSCNGGGLLYVEQYIESWACGGSFISYECDMIDGSLITVSKHADVNHDGMITSEDYLSSDINLYCIISPGSFSCGNLLPYRLKERTNCKFIGDRSGGGACTLENYRYLPVGGNCRLSSFVGTATLDSTVENMKSIEDGVEADFYKIPCTEENYAKYFDRPAIVEKIHNAGK